MSRKQARTVTVLRAALLRVLRSEALHRALTVAGLVAVGWLIGGSGQAAHAETRNPVEPASQAVTSVLRLTDAAPTNTAATAPAVTRSLAATAEIASDEAAPAVPHPLGTAPQAVPGTLATAPRAVPGDGGANALPRTLATAAQSVPGRGGADALPGTLETVVQTVPAGKAEALPETLVTVAETVPGSAGDGALGPVAQTVPEFAGAAGAAPRESASAGEDNGSWTPRPSRPGDAAHAERAATGASKSPVAKKKAVHTKKTRPVAGSRQVPAAPAYEAGVLPPAAGGAAVAPGWVALPHRRQGSAVSPRLVLVLASRLGAGLPPVNAVVDEPSFSPD